MKADIAFNFRNELIEYVLSKQNKVVKSWIIQRSIKVNLPIKRVLVIIYSEVLQAIL